MKKILSIAILSAVAVSAWCAGAGDLNSKDDIVRRSAFRKMLKDDREQAISLGLRSKDTVIYSRALLEKFKDQRGRCSKNSRINAKRRCPS